MLMTVCLLGLVCGADPSERFPAVSAEAAAYRARVEVAEEQIRSERRETRTEVDGFRELFFSTPVARINGKQLTAGQVLLRHQPYLDYLLRHPNKNIGFSALVGQTLRRDLSAHIEKEVLYQAAERDWSPMQFAASVRRLEFDFDNHGTLELMDQLGDPDQAAGLLAGKCGIDLAILRASYVRERLPALYLSQRAVSEDRSTVVSSELNLASIHTAYELPSLK